MTDRPYDPQAGAYSAAGPAPTEPVRRGGAGMATAALVLGILALLTSFTVIGGIVLGILALILGILALRKANRGEADGRGRAIAGIVTGVLGVIIAVVLVAVGASLLNSKSGKNLQSCLKNANGNQSAVQKCQQQYQNDITK